MTGLFYQRGEAGISLADRPQTRLACQRILRFIHQQKLKVGDRLPPGNELSRQINVCSDTFHSAMKVMAASGVLERKQKRGTTVQRLSPGGHGPKLFRVGLLWRRIESPFIHLMFNMARHALHHRACDDCSYPASGMHEEIRFNLDRQPQLCLDIEQGRIDGLISYGEMRGSPPIPVCNLNNISGNATGIVIDPHSVVCQGLRLLSKLGCRRPLVIYVASFTPDRYHLDHRNAQEAMRDAGLTPDDDNLAMLYTRDQMDAVYNAHFTDTPADRMPDGVIITEDHVAGHFSRKLRASGRSPRLIVQTNRQLPMEFLLPVIRFEVDADEMARRAVDMLVDAMLNLSVLKHAEKYAPRLCLEDLPPDIAPQLGRSSARNGMTNVL
ncbi:MAG: GntR family transcriptional regulator [Phycisphaerales bacterium]